jgi:hypothetical protein
MKIPENFALLIITGLVLIAAEKKASCENSCTIRCEQRNNLPAGHCERDKNKSKQAFDLIYEKDYLFRLIPSYSKFY